MKKLNLKRLAVSLAVLQLLAPLHSFAVTYELRTPVPNLTVAAGSGSTGSGSSGSSGSGGSNGSGSGTITEPPVLQVTTARWGQTLLDFSGVALGTSDSKTVKLFNDGNIAANYSALSSVSAPFSVDTSACSSVQPNASCDVVVIFHPETMGTSTSSGLHPTSGAHLNTLSVTGKGLVTSLELSDSTISSFDNTYVGQTSSAKTVLLRNNGNVPIVIDPIPNLTGPFTGATTCATELGEAQTCFINVQFAPTSQGAASGAISVVTGAGEQAVTLSGWGLVPLTASLSGDWKTQVPVSGETGSTTVGGANSMYRVYVLPSGNDSQLAANFALSDTSTFTFSYVKKARVVTAGDGATTRQEADCGAVLTGNAVNNCVADSTYPLIVAAINRTPTSEGEKSAILSSTFQGGPLPALTLKTQATGTPAAVVTGTGSFGLVDTGASATQTFVLQNTGTGTLSLTSVPVIGGADSALFAIDGTSCGNNLAPGASCTTNVKFSPVSTQVANATLTFASSAPTSPTVATLSGTGASTILGLAAKSGSSANFGSVAINDSSTQTFVVTNTGNKTATGVAVKALTRAGLSIGGGTSNTCGIEGTPVTLAPNGTCEFKVTYTPTSVVASWTDAVSVLSSTGQIDLPVSGASTTPVDPYFGSVQILMHGDGNLNNQASNTLTAFNVSAPTSNARFGTGSISFTGNNSYLWAPQSGAFTLGGTYTIEAFVKPTTVSGNRPIFTQQETLKSNFASLSFSISSNQLKLAVRPTTGAAETVVAGGLLLPNNWHHVAVSVVGGYARLFVNGSEVASGTMPNLGATPSKIAFGANSNGYSVSSEAFGGFMDEIRLTTGVARYTTGFAVPVLAFPNSAN